MTEAQESGQADEADREPEAGPEGLSSGDRHVLTASPLIWVLLAGALGWAIWATVTGGQEGDQQGLRAVIVPTAGADRTVVALPCQALGAGSSNGQPTGGTSVVLPRDSGPRVVLIPGCRGGSTGAGATAGGGGGGSGGVVHVLAPGTPLPQPGGSSPISLTGQSGDKPKLQSVFTVPDTSGARVIVVARCPGKRGASGTAPATPPTSGHGLLVAPPCQSASG